MLARTDLHTVGIGHLACEQVIYSSNQSLCRFDILHLCVRQLGRNPSKERQHVLCAGKVTFCLALHGLFPHPLICRPITGNCSLCGERCMNSCGSSSHKRQAMSHRYACIGYPLLSHRLCSTATSVGMFTGWHLNLF